MDRTLHRAAGGLSAAALVLAGAVAPAAAQPRLGTWHPWQLDAVLVAWAVRQVAPATVFESVPKGDPIDAEIALDTPDARYRRSGQRTAFDEAVRHLALAHPCLPRLQEAARVVELAAWRKPEYPRVEAFEAAVLKVTPAAPMRGGLEAAFAQIDRYCQDATWQPGR